MPSHRSILKELRSTRKFITTQIPLYINGTINILVDIGLVATILPRVLSLEINNSYKYALVAIISVGWIVVAVRVLRMVCVGLTLGKPGGVVGPPWDTYNVSIWTSTDIYIGLICASAPRAKPLLVKIKGWSRTYGTSGINLGSIELSSKMKKDMMGSVTIHRSTSKPKLTGLYTEVLRKAGAESLNGKFMERGESLDGQIYKTSEITVQNTAGHAYQCCHTILHTNVRP